MSPTSEDSQQELSTAFTLDKNTEKKQPACKGCLDEKIKTTKPKKPIKVEKQNRLKVDTKLEDEIEKQAAEVISKMNGEILNKRVIRKGKEIDFEVDINNIFYLFKLKNKKKLTEKDISVMYTQLMEQKRPFIVMTPAEVPKKIKAFKEKMAGDLIKIIKI